MAAETKMAATMEEANSDAAAVTALSELTALLSPSSPAAPEAAEAALSLSGSASGRALLAANPAALSALAAMAASASRGAHTALAALVNASSEPAALEPLLAALPSLLPLLPSSGGVCGVLANLSRDAGAAPRAVRALGPGAEPLLRALSAARPPAELGALLCNLSQAPEGRRALLERSGRVVRRMLALVRYPGSAELRRGVVGALRNCCFEHEHHEWLLGPEVEALPALLLPLAGSEEIPESDTEQLPVDLQYLPQEHQREEEPEIRKMLLETLLLLTATKGGRIQMRSQGCYVVLRELHSWEQEPQVLNTCEKVIQVLIGDEPEAGLENLLEVTIPEELERRLARLDTEGQGQQGTASAR
ncbi:protein HGH1 homolog isoform X2 [Catharus ustulatus]|uniref:protein HGH1 homolog isoform X1 n=1 Tax=Catharus ustulatus TaxID=91951 RepID=UPI001407469F|nr:protein HGH1 homolog isoform X1 [Catharus ustulatus]XP_042635393.1 protein HGH1 homolog isoform X2 [Catharus ustulatus]